MCATPIPAEIGPVSSRNEERSFCARHVNPIWVKLLDTLGMNVRYIHCIGANLYAGHCLDSIRSVVEAVHASKVFWTDALDLGCRSL